MPFSFYKNFIMISYLYDLLKLIKVHDKMKVSERMDNVETSFEINLNLSDMSISKINEKIIALKSKIEKNQEELLKLKMMLEYTKLKNKGYSKKTIKNFYNQDMELINTAKKYLRKQQTCDKNYMFGYPANLSDGSAVIEYLRWIEGQLSYMNSCGTAYEKGNYRMCLHDNELEIISRFIENLGLSHDEYWGYITTGGTEGNLWGIREGFSHYPNGKLYFSDATHYSVIKGINIISNSNYEIISSNKGKINCTDLINRIESNYKKDKSEAILLLNYGTTELGSIDDIKLIKTNLIKKNIPHYIHVDEALYGGIPRNQHDSPISQNNFFNKLKIDSISISLHKYIGVPKTNGILLARTQSNNRFIEYIGQSDVTLCGSRDYLPFTTVQKIRENFDRNNEYDYSDNVKYMEQQLKNNNITFFKGNEYGNIFIISKPNNRICEKFQLATFKYKNEEKAHIIVFPSHKKEKIDELINDIIKNRCK